MSTKPNLDHPTFKRLKERFPDKRFRATEYRGQSTLILDKDDLLEVMAFLRDDESCGYNFLSDVLGVDYLDYPSETIGRFAVIYNLCAYEREDRFFVKVFLDPTGPTDGIEDDPGLHLDSVCSIWPGAEWNEREVFDMFGIRFEGHPDMRRILMWETYPAHPLRKDYPVIGRGERENFDIVSRTDA